jgi:hypothetical protein
MRRKKKGALTLLEVIIAISITGFLLSALWGLYRNWHISHQKIQKSETRLYRIVFLKQRLQNICNSVAFPDGKNCVFTSTEGGAPFVCFSYKPEIDIDPIFHQTLRSLLYFDSKAKTLCLCTFADEEHKRMEVLLDQVTCFDVSFFDRQTLCWTPSWSQDMEHLPLWMKILVETKEEKETLIFRLHHLEEPILYFDMLTEGKL